MNEIQERCREMLGGIYLKNAGLSDEQQKRLKEIGFFEAPASKRHHLAVPMGLYAHSVNVTHRLLGLTEAMQIDWSREESPYLVGMLHDLVKTRCYLLKSISERVKDGVLQDEDVYEYVQPAYPGHGVASALIAAELGIRLNEDERAAIVYHMGLYGVGKEYTDREINEALGVFPGQIIATHSADWLATRIDESGDFSDK